MDFAWTLLAGLAIALAAGLVTLVGVAMARSDRDLRGFVEVADARFQDRH